MLPVQLQAHTHVLKENLSQEILCVGCHTPRKAFEMIWYEDYYVYENKRAYSALPFCSYVCLLSNWQMKGVA